MDELRAYVALLGGKARSLAAYRTSFEDGKGVLIMKPDDEFLRYFEQPAQKR